VCTTRGGYIEKYRHIVASSAGGLKIEIDQCDSYWNERRRERIKAYLMVFEDVLLSKTRDAMIYTHDRKK